MILITGGIVPAAAAEIDGAWSTDPDVCDKMFVKNGGKTMLTTNADLFGSGFVINGNLIRGKMATCKITSLRQDGSKLHLRASCATEITLTDNSFDLNMDGPNKVVRAYPGLPELDMPYYRCP
jgi:hypothetical protein